MEPAVGWSTRRRRRSRIAAAMLTIVLPFAFFSTLCCAYSPYARTRSIRMMTLYIDATIVANRRIGRHCVGDHHDAHATWRVHEPVGIVRRWHRQRQRQRQRKKNSSAHPRAPHSSRRSTQSHRRQPATLQPYRATDDSASHKIDNRACVPTEKKSKHGLYDPLQKTAAIATTAATAKKARPTKNGSYRRRLL